MRTNFVRERFQDGERFTRLKNVTGVTETVDFRNESKVTAKGMGRSGVVFRGRCLIDLGSLETRL